MLENIIVEKFITVKDSDTVKEALEKLSSSKVNGAPVLNDNGKLVGIIVKADLYRFLMEDGHIDSCPVEWVMTKNVITANEDEENIDIVKRIRKNNIVAIPVVDKELNVKGMVTLESIIDVLI